MKYSEFLQLTEVLEAKGTTLYKELGIEKLNEDKANYMTPTGSTLISGGGKNKKEKVETPTGDKPEEVSTEKGHWFSRYGRMKSTLNEQGKKMQEQLNEKIVAKYLPKMVEAEFQIAQEILNAIKENKQEEEIKQIVANKRKQIAQIQRQQIEVLSKAIDQLLTNTGKRLDSKIESSKMKDANKLALKNYWLLLKSQIHMNALFFMQTTISSKVKEALKDNKAAEDAFDEINKGSLLLVAANDVGKIVKKNRDTVVAGEEDIKKGEKSDTATINPNDLKQGETYKHKESTYKYEGKTNTGKFKFKNTVTDKDAYFSPEMIKSFTTIEGEESKESGTTSTKGEGEQGGDVA